MPPKKVEGPEKKPLIGRVGTNLRVGIVGTYANTSIDDCNESVI